MKTVNIITRSNEIRPNEISSECCHRKDCNLLVDGKILLPEWQSSIKHIRNGLFIIYTGGGGGCRLINVNGKDLIPFPCNNIILINNGSVVVTDNHGFSVVDHFDTKKMLFKVRRTSDNKENLVRYNGNAVYPNWFDRYEIEDPIFVKDYIEVVDNGRINFVNAKTGALVSKEFFENNHCSNFNVIHPAMKSYGQSFVAVVKFHGRWKTLLSNGELV